MENKNISIENNKCNDCDCSCETSMFEEMKAAIENGEIDGQFGYDGQYADYVNSIYGEATREASQRVRDDIFIEPSIQGSMGGVFMTCSTGTTNWDFESECDILYGFAEESETEEEFKEKIVGFILDKYADCYPEAPDEYEDEEDDAEE